ADVSRRLTRGALSPSATGPSPTRRGNAPLPVAPLQPVAGAPPRRANLDPRDHHRFGPARADDPVQGEVRQGGPKPGTAVLPGVDGGRHSHPPGPRRARRRRSDPTPGADP